MHIIYPYNEILPTRKAHDHHLFQSCASLNSANCKVTLLCGKGSLSLPQLQEHYQTNSSLNLHILPIIRKNNPFNLSWNYPFFYCTQQYLNKTRPDVVIFTVFKQGVYHLQRKIPCIKYLYEVHELKYYPGHTITSEVEKERDMLSQADLVIVTTKALQKILRETPYNLKNPIEVLPLATHTKPLPLPHYKQPLHLFYVGSLYEGQGIDLLLKALSLTKEITLTIIGGKSHEVAHFQKQIRTNRVRFLGFQPPSLLPTLVQEADGFVAPFSPQGRMNYVAHTKLHEYAAWQRPFIAPDLPIVREHFSPEQGVLLFRPDDPSSLADAMTQLQDLSYRQSLQQKISSLPPFTWEHRTRKLKPFLIK